MALISNTDSGELKDWILEYIEWIQQDIGHKLRVDLDSVLPDDVKAILKAADDYRSWRIARENSPTQMDPVDVPDQHLRILKNAVLFKRKKIARELERPLSKAINHDVREQIKEKQRNVEKYFSHEWFKGTEVVQVPSISKYIGIKYVEQFQMDSLKIEERDYDEKFSILQAPRLFYSDMHFYSEKCRARNSGIIVGYMDIDNFKSFNSEYTEPVVDSELLPIFMNTLESHFYGHGFAYRYGGDEYTFVIPNMDLFLAASFVKSFMIKLKDLKFGKITRNPTVSVGIYHVRHDNIYTEREIEAKANKAKNYAKSTGKDCICILSDDSIGNEKLDKAN